MKKLTATKLLLMSSALTFAACTPSKMNSYDVSGDNSHIIQGDEVQADDPIAQVTVAINAGTVDKDLKTVENFSCTGTIIKKNIILTAAHCIPVAPEGGKRGAVIVFNRSYKNVDKTKDIRRVVRMETHDLWEKTGPEEENTHDFGLMEFDGDLPEGYKVASLLPVAQHANMKVGDSIIVAGYGLMDDTKKLSSDSLRKGVITFGGVYGQTEIISDQTSRKGVCSGDSGGPAFYEVNGKLYVFGVASRVAPESEATKDAYCSGISIHGVIALEKKFINTTLRKWAAEDKAAAEAAAGSQNQASQTNPSSAATN